MISLKYLGMAQSQAQLSTAATIPDLNHPNP